VVINSTFCSTKECAMSRRSTIMNCGRPPPSSTSSIMVEFSLSSHTLHLVVVKSCMYSMQNPNASSSAKPFAMLPSGLALFHTYPFKVFKYLSIGYIQWVWTGPHNFSSSIRCTKRCVMMSKNSREGILVRTTPKSLPHPS